jgi:protein-disulfide isomerase
MPKAPRENRRKEPAKKESGDKVTRWIVISMVALVVITGAVVSVFSQSESVDEDFSALDGFSVQAPLQSVVSEADDQAIVFNQGADLKISLWEDFQCPVCQQFEAGIGGYVEELVRSGEAEVAFHTASFLGPESRRAANAAYCAADEGYFLDFHKALYVVQSPIENAGYWSPDNLIKIGQKIGIDSENFASCVRGDGKRDLVTKVADSMMKYGVDGTPTVFINGKVWNRTNPAFDVNEFRAAVEAARG